MTTNSINFVRVMAPGKIIDDLGKELKAAEVDFTRSPRYFSGGALEHIDVLITSSASLLEVAAGILIAYIKKDRRVRVSFNDNGTIREIDASSDKNLKEVLALLRPADTDD